jgi:DNA polymerase
VRAVTLSGDTDLEGFRHAARGLVAAGVKPEDVAWHMAGSSAGGTAGLFDAPPSPTEPASGPALQVPAAFAALCERAILHRDPQRFALLYRLLWRLLHEPGLRHDPIDADMIEAQHMAQAVRREMHKMTAFVRFRSVAGDRHVAWFEPEHHVVEATAPFFVRRFAQMHWAILTPRRCVRWDGTRLEYSPGAHRSEAPPADAGEQLWLTYYEHIFNPARLKLAMMQKEMPRRYWHNLPEARLIAPLAARANLRSETMVEQGHSTPHKRRPAMPMLVPTQALPAGDAPATLAALQAQGQRCRECPIGAQATQAVFGEGPAGARLMLVGEQPGDHEDLRGRPFVGPAGQLLDRALTRLGWPRETLFLTNAVKHFKYELRGKRRLHKTAAQREAQACAHWLESEITLVEPQAIVALGATAARSLLGRQVAVMSERGQWFERSDGRRVLVTLHPSALLRSEPEERGAAFERWLQDLALAA